MTMDTQFYLQIAQFGYRPKGKECAFYPLWPGVVRAGSFLTGRKALVAGYLLTNLFSLIGLLLLHRFLWEKHGLKLANRATILLLLFPGSIFFVLPYTESLFLLLLAMLFWALHRDRYSLAAAAALLLPMTRPIGIFILPVMAWEMCRKRKPAKNYLFCAAPLAGYLVYFAIMFWFTGNPFEGFTAQQEFPAKPSIAKIGDPVGFAHHFFDFKWSHTPLHSALDRALFITTLLLLIPIFQMDRGYYIYAAMCGVVPALSNELMSYTRFLSVVFPVFVVSARLLINRGPFIGVSATLFFIQIGFLLRHISSGWVG